MLAGPGLALNGTRNSIHPLRILRMGPRAARAPLHPILQGAAVLFCCYVVIHVLYWQQSQHNGIGVGSHNALRHTHRFINQNTSLFARDLQIILQP